MSKTGKKSEEKSEPLYQNFDEVLDDVKREQAIVEKMAAAGVDRNVAIVAALEQTVRERRERRNAPKN